MKIENERLCPLCKKMTKWKNNPYLPFCSKRCKMTDLGQWAMERYSVSCEEQEPPMTSPFQTEQNMTEQNDEKDTQ